MLKTMIPLTELERFGPSLRRAARALAGLAPEKADALVLDALRRSLLSTRPHAISSDVWMLRVLVEVHRARPALVEAAPAPTEGVDGALAALPRELREALVMVVVERLSYADAAFVLSIPLAMLIDRLTRARDLFRAALEQQAAADVPARAGRPHLRLVT